MPIQLKRVSLLRQYRHGLAGTVLLLPTEYVEALLIDGAVEMVDESVPLTTDRSMTNCTDIIAKAGIQKARKMIPKGGLEPRTVNPPEPPLPSDPLG